MPITKGYARNKIEKMLDCYDDDGLHQIQFHPEKLEDVGKITIEIFGVPKVNALKIFNDNLIQ